VTPWYAQPIQPPGIGRPYRILVVCTANQCRSPMAAALIARRLHEVGVASDVRSAGLLEGGRPAWPEASAAMAERGIDLSAHRSRRIEPQLVASADLVVGMTREHLREAVALDPIAYGRSFTLKELVRRAGVQPRGPQALDPWLAHLAAEREIEDLLGASPIDDVEDPIGGPLSAVRATAAELDGLVRRLVGAAWPAPR